MESITSLLSIALGAILVNNFVLSQFLGICPFLGVSKKVETALGMGMAVTFVMGVASAVNWPINEFLNSHGLGFMQTVTFILVIASLVQFVEMFLQKMVPSLYEALGVPASDHHQLRRAGRGAAERIPTTGESLTYGITGGLGFLLAIVLFASVRNNMEFSKWPKAFDGFPIALVAASSVSLWPSLWGFSGLESLVREAKREL